MIGEVMKFLFILIIILFVESSVASLLFGGIESYAGFFKTFFIMFGTGLGNYELGEFDGYIVFPPLFCKFYIFVCVIVNSIILLNFIIAILADTYTKLSAKSLGLYYDGIIARIPVYEDDSRYGGLIIGIPPVNIFAVLLVPFFCLSKDKRSIRAVNEIFTKLIYAPIAVLITACFAAFSLLMVPFAYLVAIYEKIKILALHKSKADEKKKKSHN